MEQMREEASITDDWMGGKWKGGRDIESGQYLPVVEAMEPAIST